jgi:predicted CXXCH cytochrome family protein
MPEPQRTQKQVAEKYKGNLDYYRRGHFFRRLRWITFLVVAVGSIAFALSFGKWGRPEFFNTGPISQNHAQLVHDCKVCHENAQPDMTRGLGLHEAAADPVEKFAQFCDWIARVPSALDSLRPAKFSATAEQALRATSLADMDEACIKCHEPQRLHQPQAAALALRGVFHEMPMVFSGACADCHREHVTSARMALPRSDACATCHNDAAKLAATSARIREEGPPLEHATAALLADGQRHFVMPRPPQPVAFKSFAEGHPKFAYEQPGARDPATIKFNHARHFEADIPPIGGRKLDCSDCHKPEPKGAFMERISYEKHCALCHELQLDPALPKLTIPHGEADKVRFFARNLTTQLSEYGLRERGLTDPNQRGQFVIGAFNRLQQRGMTTVEELERRIFFVGDPPITGERFAPKSNANQTMTACAKCHEVKAGEGGATPTVAHSGIADRWLTRGPFSHLPHVHLDCAECHASPQHSLASAYKSTRTADILLPKKSMCADCHRALDRDKVQPIPANFDPSQIRAAVTAKQRREGGVKEDCQSCHQFHSPREVSQFIRTFEAVKKSEQ